MKRCKEFFAESAAELKNPRTLVLAALLTAIYAVSYSPFAGNIIIVPGLFEIRFGFLVLAVAGALLGPCAAMLVALLGDFTGTIIFYGGSFFLAYPLIWILTGLLFGCFFYREKLSLPRIVCAAVVYTVLVRQILTPLAQAASGYGGFKALFFPRILLNAVMLPVNVVLLLFVLRTVCGIYRRIVRAA